MQISVTHPTLKDHLLQKIEKEGPIPFSDFMSLALYHPTQGYYCRKKSPFGSQGDFITAPQLTPLFSHCIAKQIIEIAHHLSEPYEVLEIGAGTGKMAADILCELAKHNTLPRCYYILEISDNLQQKQKDLIKKQLPQDISVQWIKALDELPSTFQGVILGNEFIDALPVDIFKVDDSQDILQGKVASRESTLELIFEKSTDAHFQQIVNHEIRQLPELLPSGYISEININAKKWIQDLSAVLQKGVMLFIDYGFNRKEFYHPQRHQGTLMCHHQHKTHDNYFKKIGEQDITAHVNFSQLAEAAINHELHVLGYTNQASFLLGLNILDSLKNAPFDKQSAQQTHALQILLQPHEMGELFKVIAFGKNSAEPLQGFSIRDYTHTL